MNSKSQCIIVLSHLKAGKTLTSKQAAKRWEIWRLASRVNDLRNVGHPIITVMRPNKNNHGKHAEYIMALRGQSNVKQRA